MAKKFLLLGAVAALLVLEATDGKAEDFAIVAQARFVGAVVQVHIVGVVATALSGTPKVGVAPKVVIVIDVPETSRQRREREIIRAIATTIPSGCGLKHLARGPFSTSGREQLGTLRCSR